MKQRMLMIRTQLISPHSCKPTRWLSATTATSHVSSWISSRCRFSTPTSQQFSFQTSLYMMHTMYSIVNFRFLNRSLRLPPSLSRGESEQESWEIWEKSGGANHWAKHDKLGWTTWVTNIGGRRIPSRTFVFIGVVTCLLAIRLVFYCRLSFR